ncbi:response regulator transcription factor [Burkholderia oklahomensis]|uniref:DNA-binding response regulator n=1 Tax=Burkholderia oklahomensis TaxID=342113 RepID=A0AAI8FQU7_9BURK|nr:response regulator transcription factor [Burkholderia oklahomensis]AIO69559.1 hypothetical protein DM82_4936 [Burkholderia oklahomensis]AOI39608.1 two-component system response regulator [Burkholderia oklahomensis EO147]KUY51539.1 two-component system response regulator [Burkholderia oklahomensis EO147]QPS40040.1 response regulator transcription factor [Burkholderia oklahomensis]
MVIYLIEDDEIQAQYYQSILAGHGWEVKILLDGERAFREIHRMTPDLVILDRRLPDLDGLEVLAWIRKNHATVPVLILTNAVLESDVVTALEAGADDYVIKPPREQEFVARVKALYRRSREIHTRPELMEIGPYKIQTIEKTVYLHREKIPLSPKEYEIIELLAQNLGQVVPRDKMVSLVWGRPPDEASFRTLDTHIYRIRQKLGLTRYNLVILRSVYRHGYRLEYIGKIYQ